MTAQERHIVEEKIKTLKEEIKEVHGTPCSVYSRVVGYLRPVQSFNDGKIEEFKLRKVHNVADGEIAKKEANILHEQNMSKFKTIKELRACC